MSPAALGTVIIDKGGGKLTIIRVSQVVELDLKGLDLVGEVVFTEDGAELVIDVITAIRNARAELRVEASKQVDVVIDAAAHKDLFVSNLNGIAALARAEPVLIYGSGEAAPTPDNARIAILGAVRVILPLAGLVDADAERVRLEKEADGLRKALARLEARLANAEFTTKAPAAVVDKERARLDEYREKLAALQARVAELG